MMDGDRTTQLITLSELCCFSKLSPSLLRLGGETPRHEKYAAQEIIYREGDRADWAYVVQSGTVDLAVRTSAGSVSIATIAANHSFGELALFCDAARLCTATARSDVDLLRLSRATYKALIMRYPEIGPVIIASLSHRLAAALAVLRDIAPLPAVRDAFCHAARPSIFAD